jgi:hypothetical protein
MSKRKNREIDLEISFQNLHLHQHIDKKIKIENLIDLFEKKIILEEEPYEDTDSDNYSVNSYGSKIYKKPRFLIKKK